MDDLNQRKHKPANPAGGVPLPETPVFPSALKKDTNVMALIRNSTIKYQLAKIVEIRLARDTSEDEEQIVQQGALRVKVVEEIKAIDAIMEDVSAKDAQMTDDKELKFDYYIHYVGE